MPLAEARKLEGVHVTPSLDSALALLASPAFLQRVEHVFVIGGGQVYQEALESPLLTAVHLTQASGQGGGARERWGRRPAAGAGR